MHPDLADLDALRTGEGTPDDAEHVRSCVACQTLLHELERIAAGLSAEVAAPFAVPEEREGRILWMARKQAAAIRREATRRPLRLFRRPAVAAAAVLVLAAVSLLRLRGSALRADVDGDGRVDIRDAFLIARTVETRGGLDPRWDVNGDGRVDLADADAVARAAVAVGGA